MSRSNKLLTVAVILVLITAFAAVAVRTFSNRGEGARAAMDSSEQRILRKLDTVRAGMKIEEVVSLLGEPDEYGPLSLRPKWKVDGSPINAYVVYFGADGARQVRWLNIGHFVYERKL